MRDVTGLEELPVAHARVEELEALLAKEDRKGSEDVETGLPSCVRFCPCPPRPVAFFEFAFAFAFTLYLAFAFDVKSIATTRGGFSRHVPILVQEVLLKRGKSALIESSVSTPGCNVRVELRPGLNRRKEVVDSC